MGTKEGVEDRVIMRAGKFYLSMLIAGTQEIPYRLAKLEFEPYRVEFRAERHSIEYMGVSPRFGKVSLWDGVPEYRVATSDTAGEDGGIIVERKK